MRQLFPLCHTVIKTGFEYVLICLVSRTERFRSIPLTRWTLECFDQRELERSLSLHIFETRPVRCCMNQAVWDVWTTPLCRNLQKTQREDSGRFMAQSALKGMFKEPINITMKVYQCNAQVIPRSNIGYLCIS